MIVARRKNMSFNFYGLMIVLLSLFPYLIEKIFIYNKPTTHLQIRNINIISLSGLIFFSIFSIENYGYHRINDTLYLLSLIFLYLTGDFQLLLCFFLFLIQFFDLDSLSVFVNFVHFVRFGFFL